MRFRAAVALAAGALATSGLATSAFAAPADATPRTRVVYSSSSYLTPDFAVSGTTLAFLACTTVYQVAADGTHGALPFPGCSAHVESGGGVAFSRDGRSLAQTFTVRTPMGPGRDVTSRLGVTSSDGSSNVVISDREWADNPDGGTTYGTTSSSACVRDALGPDASYPGRLDSSLSAVAAGADGWYVADRDGNTVYRVDKENRLSVLAVLPRVKVEVTRSLAASFGWPRCVVGTTVAFEAAPNEVEVGPDGAVYVAGLPSLASGRQADRSVISRIDPKTGKITRLSQRYAGPVDLAVGTTGRLFAARPHAGKISVIKKGRSHTYLRLAEVQAVETDAAGRLYAVQGPRTGAHPHDADVVRVG